MNYKMNVTITKEGKEKTYNLDCVFLYDAEDYGNKYYLSITDDKDFDKYLDIRYDTSFRSNNKEKYLEEWARNYWTGENGAWDIKSLEVLKAE